MACRIVETPIGNTFLCGDGPEVPLCKCGNTATHRCDFALRGRRSGDACGRPLCERCKRDTPIGVMCRVHAELDAKERFKIRGEQLPDSVKRALGIGDG